MYPVALVSCQIRYSAWRIDSGTVRRKRQTKKFVSWLRSVLTLTSVALGRLPAIIILTPMNALINRILDLLDKILGFPIPSPMNIAPGGREGGEGTFLLGLLMTIVGVWLFFDSVRIVGGHHGFFSGMMGRGRGAGGGMMGTTTSMGIVLVPLFAGVVALFFDARKK